VRKGKMLSVEDVDAILRLPLLGVIPDEPGIIIATNNGRPIALEAHSQVGAAYRQIARRLAGEDVPAPTVKVAEPGFLAKVGSFFGGR
jgi:septum site-determining protein MinD